MTAPADLLAMDARVARAAAGLRRDRRALRADPEAPQTWHERDRDVTTRTAFADVSALLPDEPLRDALRRWVYRLAVERIAEPAIIRVARARAAPIVEIEHPEPERISVRAAVHRMLAEPSRAGRHLLQDALRRAVADVVAAERDRAAAVREITARLGADDAARLTAPCPVEPLAVTVLADTADLARAVLGGASFADVVGTLVGRDTPGVWPRLSRFTEDLFGTSALVEGLDLDIAPPPKALGASTFVRSLHRFGAAYACAAAPRDLPFVVGHDATGTHPLRRGALFGLLLADRTFCGRALGLSREAARAVARSVSVALLGSARTLAALAAAPADVADAMEQALAAPYPRELAAVVPRPRSDAGVRLAALALAVSDERTLIDGFDEDWWRSPRALVHLREEDAVPPPAQMDPPATGVLRLRLESALA